MANTGLACVALTRVVFAASYNAKLNVPPASVGPVPGVTVTEPVAGVTQEGTVTTVAVGVTAAGKSRAVVEVTVLPQSSVARTK